MRQYDMKHPFSYYGMTISVWTLSLYVIYVLAMGAWKPAVIVWRHDIEVDSPVYAGEHTNYHSHFVKLIAAPGEVGIMLTNGKGYTVPIMVGALTNSVGIHDVTTPFYIPVNAPPGEMWLQMSFKWWVSRFLLEPTTVMLLKNSTHFVVLPFRGKQFDKAYHAPVTKQ